MISQSRGARHSTGFVVAGAGSRLLRRLTVGVVLAMMAAVLSLPSALAQDQESTVANDTRSSASSDSEIKAGDIVTGLNSGNVVATGDNHNSTVQINGGNSTSPTYIDFYIDGGWSDSYSDAGYNESVADGPQVGKRGVLGDDNSPDNSVYEDNGDYSTCC